MLTALLNHNLLRIYSPKKDDLLELELPPEIVKDSKILDQKGLAKLVGRAVDERGWRGKKVVVGLNEENTVLVSLSVGKEVDDYLSQLEEAIRQQKRLSPEKLFLTNKIVGEGATEKFIQVAGVEKSFLNSLASALLEAGLKIDYFVPLSLGLVSLANVFKKPQLLIATDGQEAVFLFVDESGLVVYSATYPAVDLLQASGQVIKFLSDKYPQQVIRQVVVCGTGASQLVADLKKNGLVADELPVRSKRYPLLALLSQFSEIKLIFRADHLAKSEEGSKPPSPKQANASKKERAGILSFLRRKRASSQDDISDGDNRLAEADRVLGREKNAERPSSLEEQRLSRADQRGEDAEDSDLPDLPPLAEETAPTASAGGEGRVKPSFLKSDKGGWRGRKAILLGAGGFAVFGALAVVLLLLRPWRGRDLPAPAPSPNQQASPTASGSERIFARQGEEATVSAQPVEEAPDRSAYSLQVLNGRGTPGLASRTKSALLELGWKDISIGNAPSREKTVIQYKEGAREGVSLLQEDLADQFEFAEPIALSADSPFDLVVIIGKE